MEITENINLQSNTSCEISLDKKPGNSIAPEYYLYDLELTSTISLNSNQNIILKSSSIPQNDIKVNYGIYGFIINGEINAQSEVISEIIKSEKANGSIKSEYNLYTLEINTDLDISCSVSITTSLTDKPRINLESSYELYGLAITPAMDLSSSMIIDIRETPKPQVTINGKYNLYTLKIAAGLDINTSIEVETNELKKPRYNTAGTYTLEDYPNFIKMEFNITSNNSLAVTYIANNETIMVLDPELNLLTYLDDTEYFSWARRWRRPDSFKLLINRYKENAEYLKVNNYLIKKTGDVLRGGQIKNREIEVNDKGQASECWLIKGRGFGEIFSQRLALHEIDVEDGFDTIEAPAETAMKYFVDVNVINPSDLNRKVPNLSIEADKKMGKTIKYKARFQKISDILYDISKLTGLGWDIKFDLNKKEFIFQVLYADLKPEIRLSTNTDSVKSISFSENHLDSINTAVVAGQGEGGDRMVVKVTEDDL